jgi:hypothetical protein
VSVFLVIERPDHSPRVLGTFSNRGDAEEARAVVVADEPGWERFVSIRTPEGNPPRTRHSFVGLWVVALVLVVDTALAYGLYRGVKVLLAFM